MTFEDCAQGNSLDVSGTVFMKGCTEPLQKITVNWVFTDTEQQYAQILENAVLNHRDGADAKPDATITLSMESLGKVFLRKSSMETLVM